TTALVAAAMLDKNPGATILFNCICSRVVPEVIAEKGGVGIRTRVGHSYIKQVMAETGAIFGGEHSGHYYFRENYRADSGIIAAMVVLELLSVSGKPLSELLAPYQRYSDSGEINATVPDPAAAVEAMAAEVEAAGGRLGTVDRLDGLTVDRGDWWYNLRPSNTEPLLRLNVEAPDDESLARDVAEVQDAVARLTGG
ncbi:MAG: phosphomannomutase/phosphoglucomutase, partial [Acidimicrobiales bacterium]